MAILSFLFVHLILQYIIEFLEQKIVLMHSTQSLGSNQSNKRFTKQQRLQIIQQLLYGRNWSKIKQNLLFYEYKIEKQHTQQTQTPSLNVNSVIKYQSSRHKQVREVSQFSFSQKIRQASKSMQSQKSISINKKSAKSTEKGLENEFQDEDQGHYINLQCHNCEEIGHQAKYCLMEKRCVNCLCAEHNEQQCQHSLVCFNCFKLGHILQNCTQKYADTYCSTCQRDHIKDVQHQKCFSLARGREQKKILYHTDRILNHPQIMCIRCGGFGHIICN